MTKDLSVLVGGTFLSRKWIKDLRILPGNTASFHVIRQRDVIGPHVELPLINAENAAENGPRMNPDPHVQIDLRRRRGEEVNRYPPGPDGMCDGNISRMGCAVFTCVFCLTT